MKLNSRVSTNSTTPTDQFAYLVPDVVEFDTLIAGSPNTPALQDDRPVNEYYLLRTQKTAVVILLFGLFIAAYGIVRRSFRENSPMPAPVIEPVPPPVIE